MRNLMIALGAALLITVSIGVGGAEAAKPRPDLKVQSVSATPASAVPGAAVTVKATVKNGGAGNAGASKAEAILSLDRKSSKGDYSIKRVSVSKLKSGKGTKIVISGSVPAAVPAGKYFVLVCADVAKKVKESNESNGCSASMKSVLLTVPAPTPPIVPAPNPPLQQSGPVGGAASLCGGARTPNLNGNIPNGYHFTVSPASLNFDGGGVQAEYVYPDDVPSANTIIYTLTNDGTAPSPLISSSVFSCHVANPTGFPSNRGALNEHWQSNLDLGGTQPCRDVVLDPGESCKGELFIDRASSAGAFSGVLQIQKVTLNNADLAIFPVSAEIFSRPYFSFTGISGGLPGSTVRNREEKLWVEAENIGTTGGFPAFEFDTPPDGKFGFLSVDPPPSGQSRCSFIPYGPGESCALQVGFCSSVDGLFEANLIAYGRFQNGATDYSARWSGNNDYSVNVTGAPDPGSCP